MDPERWSLEPTSFKVLREIKSEELQTQRTSDKQHSEGCSRRSHKATLLCGAPLTLVRSKGDALDGTVRTNTAMGDIIGSTFRHVRHHQSACVMGLTCSSGWQVLQHITRVTAAVEPRLAARTAPPG
jgi:hypothetical protein